MKKEIAILGIPSDLGSETLGVDIAPDAFRDKFLVEKLEKCGFSVSDLGNIKFERRDKLRITNKKLKYLEEIVRFSNISAQKVKESIENGKRVVVIGGDHSVAMGSISGASIAKQNKIGLIWIDAHGDINTDKTTLTGNIHGMPLAAVLGLGAKQLTSIGDSSIKVQFKNVVHVGGCDYDDAEIEIMNKYGVWHYDIEKILASGLGGFF